LIIKKVLLFTLALIMSACSTSDSPNQDLIIEIPDEITFPNSNMIIVRFNDDNLGDDLDYYYSELSRVE